MSTGRKWKKRRNVQLQYVHVLCMRAEKTGKAKHTPEKKKTMYQGKNQAYNA